jgi:hypothetical protein
VISGPSGRDRRLRRERRFFTTEEQRNGDFFEKKGTPFLHSSVVKKLRDLRPLRSRSEATEKTEKFFTTEEQRNGDFL